jgi:glycosyltransferase involved in cell wall biosynthesis
MVDRLLIVGDSPTLNSGFARVIQSLARRWRSRFERIDFWAINYSGWLPHESEWRDPKYVLFPANFTDHSWASLERMNALLAHIKSSNYSHVWIVQDHFLLTLHEFPRELRKACEATTDYDGKPVPQKKLYYYCPVDASMEAVWTRIIEAVDFPVAYTNYAKREIQRHTGIKRDKVEYPDIQVLPHGVDTNTFKPFDGGRLAFRKSATGGWLEEDDILLINVNMNQRRKDVTRTLEILAELRKVDKRFKLIMHMSDLSTGQDGVSLTIAARQLGLVKGQDWDCSDNGDNFKGGLGRLTEKQLNDLYNCADIYLTTTLGEGFGLGIVEAAAAGCTVAVPIHTACLEIADGFQARDMGDRVIRLPLEQGFTCLNLDNSRMRPRVDTKGAVAAILNYTRNFKPQDKRSGLSNYAEKWLSWDKIAAEWVKLFDQPKPPRRYYIEIYGGLGDAFNILYHRSAAETLDNLKDGEMATVVLYCNNPFAPEIFENHPKREQIEVIDTELWKPDLKGTWPELVLAAKVKHGLPLRRGALDSLPKDDQIDVTFYPSPKDLEALPPTGVPYIVLAHSAGLPDRNIPVEIVASLCDKLYQIGEEHGVFLCLTGRTYERHGRTEVPLSSGSFDINLIDKLSAPGFAQLVQQSLGVITCHSVANALAYRMGKPQLLLYPPSVEDGHYAKGDQWAFGKDDPLCIRSTFEKYEPQMLDRFLRLALGPLYK